MCVLETHSFLTLQNPTLIENLGVALKEEDKDTVARQNILGTLQKLSLRRSAQSIMIEMGEPHFSLVLLTHSP
jgi:hypothetical protein